jgi:putative colanic acid biosysnthesis UDP-glucose lipid carrier transferase
MNKLSFYSYRIILWLWDILSLNIVLLILGVFIERAEVFKGNDYFLYFLSFNLFWMASVFLTALYLSKNWLDIQNFSKETLKCYFITILGTLFFVFLLKKEYSRLFITLSFVGFGLALILNRFIFYVALEVLKKNFQIRKNVIVLGDNDISKRLINYFQKESKLVNVLGCFDDQDVISENGGLKIIGKLRESVSFAKENDVTEIYSTIAPEAHPYLYDLAKDAENHFIHFKFVPDYQIFVNRNIFVDFIDDIPVLSLRNEPLEDTGNKIKKRIFDIVFSSLVIIFILSWLVPIIAILIKLSSKGPVFFVQPRSGKSNQPFNCLKFRSLRVNDDANVKQVTKDDNRITPIGRFLRKSNIDELPQFFNVFMGDMSVVGPRPHMLKHTTDFTNIYKQYMIRHFIKPGLTGWAQVHGFRGEIKDHDFLIKRIEYDIWYMENWSIWLDMKIIIMTIYTTFKGDKNAY